MSQRTWRLFEFTSDGQPARSPSTFWDRPNVEPDRVESFNRRVLLELPNLVVMQFKGDGLIQVYINKEVL